MRTGSVAFICILITLVSSAFCEDTDKPVWEITGWGWMTQGQIVRSAYNDKFSPNTYSGDTIAPKGKSLYGENYFEYDFSHAWLNDIDAGIRATCQLGPRSKMCINVGMDMRFNTVIAKDASVEKVGSFSKTVRPVILESSVSTNWMNMAWLKLDSKAGYFSYKYNPEAQNLGEYLFRSNVYPNILVSGFEIADKAKVMGFKGHAVLWDRLEQDIFLTSESEMYPTYDFSLSYLLRAQPVSCLDMGAGVSFSRLFPVNENRTTPGSNSKAFKSGYDRFFARSVDTISGDTTLYTFQGTKLMARLTFDPKKLLPMPFLGSADLKIYGEIALLGVKNYPLYYEKRSERMPVMAGINMPTFKLLDVLSVELEWYKSPFPNSSRFIWEDRSPIPFTGRAQLTDVYSPEKNTYDFKDKDNFKWSVYASKRLNKLLRLSLQVANDHSQRDDYGLTQNGTKIYQEICQDTKDWYWITRLTFGM